MPSSSLIWKWIMEIHINSPYRLWILLKQTISLGQGEVPMTQRDVVVLQSPKFDPYSPYPFYRLQSPLFFLNFRLWAEIHRKTAGVPVIPLIIPSICNSRMFSSKVSGSFPTKVAYSVNPQRFGQSEGRESWKIRTSFVDLCGTSGEPAVESRS